MINSTPLHLIYGSGAAASLTTLVSNMTIQHQLEQTIEKVLAKEFEATHSMMNKTWNFLLDGLYSKTSEAEELRQTAINQKEKLLEIKDVAKMFSTTKTTIHNHMTRGWLKGFKVGKKRFFTDEDIEAYKRMSGYNAEK